LPATCLQLFVPSSLCIRVENTRHMRRSRVHRQRRSDPAFWLLLHLPIQAKDTVRQYVECWNSSTSLPITTDFPLGADGFLLNNASSSQRMLSLPDAAGKALGAAALTFVLDRRRGVTGGVLNRDILLFYASERNFSAIRSALLEGSDLQLKPSSKTFDCGLRIRWFDSGVITAGLSHIEADTFPDRTVHPNSHLVGNLSEGLVLPLIASETREMLCPNMHQRITVLGVGVGVPSAELEQRVDRHHLEEFLAIVLESISTRLGKLITEPPSSGDASLITLHIDLEPRDEESSSPTYRISKNYGETCPQAPELSMRKWSRMLHPLPTPPVQGPLTIQVSLEVV